MRGHRGDAGQFESYPDSFTDAVHFMTSLLVLDGLLASSPLDYAKLITLQFDLLTKRPILLDSIASIQ